METYSVFSKIDLRIKNSEYNDMIYFWRSKGGAEVDFVRRHGDTVEAFEAKASHMKRPKISRSARSFIGAYSPARFYMVNLNLSAEMVINKTAVRWITPLEFKKLDFH